MASEANGPLSIIYSGKDVLGKGEYGVDFLCLFDGRQVAVRRVPKEYISTVSNEDEILQLKHPNIVKLLKIEDSEEFRLYAFDLVVGNLDDFGRGKYSGPMPDDKQAMLQMAKGLEYIHSKQIIHCNLRPQNIRISNDVPTRLMITVFGCCKQTSEDGSISTSRAKETDGWMAPEIIECHQVRDDDDDVDEEEEGGKLLTVSSNIWTLGCLFFYFLTRGKHPFGNNTSDINWNVSVTRKPVELEKWKLSDGIAFVVIKSMIKLKPTERLQLNRVILYLEEVPCCGALTPEVLPHPQGVLSSPKFAEFAHPQEKGRWQSDGASSDRQFEIYAQCGGVSSDGEIFLEAQIGGIVQRTGGSSSDRRNPPRVVQAPARDFAGLQIDNRYPTPGEFWMNRSFDRKEERQLWNERWLFSKVQELENKLRWTSDELSRTSDELSRTSDELLKKIKNSNEKIGHLHETAIRKKVTTYATKRSLEYREIKSLAQLVKCCSEAKGIKSSEEDNSKMCRNIVCYLKKKESERHFCQWYYDEAIKNVKPKPIKDAISKHQCLNKKGIVNYAVTAEYKKSPFLRNYIDGPMTADDWNNFSGTSSSVFLLVLFESLEGKKDLMSFPPPGILTMDVPVKISTAKNSVHIEIGEIKSSDYEAVIHKARKQLKISLLCFQWLDKIIQTLQVEYYGLIGNIYIDGNRQSNTENSEDYEEEFTFKLKYETYT